MNVGQFFVAFILCAGVFGIGVIVAVLAWFAGDFPVLADGLKVMALAWVGSVVALLMWVADIVRDARARRRNVEE